MSFKTAGFPDFRFNSIGLRTQNPIARFNACGILLGMSNGATDKVGKSARGAVQGVSIVGNATTSIKADQPLITANGYFDIVIYADSQSVRGGLLSQYESAVANRFYIAWELGGYIRYFHELNSGKNGINAYTTDVLRKVRFVKDAVSTRVYVDDVLEITDINRTMLEINTTLLADINPSYVGRFFELTVEIDKTYTLNTNGDWSTPSPQGKYELVPSDGSEPIVCQQFLAPAVPTIADINVISMADEYGYTIADGTQTYDIAGTNAYAVGAIIPNQANGVTSIAYVDGVHPIGEFLGRAKYNFIDDGTNLKLSDTWHEVAQADTERILTELDGTPKVLLKSAIANITNKQFYYNTNGKILLFKEALSGNCEIKANLCEGFIEPVSVEEGELFTDEGQAYVVKEGVTQA